MVLIHFVFILFRRCSPIFNNPTPKVSYRLSGNNMNTTTETTHAQAVSSTDLLGSPDTPCAGCGGRTHREIITDGRIWDACGFCGRAYSITAMTANNCELECENTRLREMLRQDRATFLALMPDFGGPIAAQMKKAAARINDVLSPNAQDDPREAGK